jgi:peptide/nickel transport system permease protein
VSHRWLRFAVRRTAVLVVSLAVLVTATFFTLHLVPGDPARTGLGPTATVQQVEQRREALNLDESLLTQYRLFVAGLFNGRLGESFTAGQPVGEIIGERFPATARLAGLAFAVTLLLGIPVGVAIAILNRGNRHRAVRGAFSATTGLLVSIPDYVMATGLVALFAVTLDWLPVAGDEGWSSYVLPVAALALLPAAGLARVARVECADVLGEDYMRVARGKRLPPRQLYVRHALPNALTATLTVSGLIFSGLIAGTVIIENVFAWPGLGSAVVQAIIDKDYPLVQGIVLLLGGIALVVNTVVDVALGMLDPRSSIAES